MTHARLFPLPPPDGEAETPAPPESRARRRGEQVDLFPTPPPTEADIIDARIAAGRAEYFTRSMSRDATRSRRKREVPARTVSVKRMTKRELAIGRELYPKEERAQWLEKPKTREECADVPRPCPFVSCRHHLYLDVSKRTGAIKLNFPDLEVEEMPADASCALDVADRDGVTLEDVGEIMNLTRERIRQVEVMALTRLKATHGIVVLEEFHGGASVAKRRLPVLQNDSGAREFDAEEFASDALDAT